MKFGDIATDEACDNDDRDGVVLTVSDLLFLYGDGRYGNISFIRELIAKDGVTVNGVFAKHPDFVVGTLDISQFRFRTTEFVKEGD